MKLHLDHLPKCHSNQVTVVDFRKDPMEQQTKTRYWQILLYYF